MGAASLVSIVRRVDARALEAVGRSIAGGYGAATFLFFLISSNATLERALVKNALVDGEHRRLLLFLIAGVVVALVVGRRVAAERSWDVFLAAPLVLWPVYEAPLGDAMRLLAIFAMSALWAYALQRFATRSPRGAMLDRLAAHSLVRSGSIFVHVFGLAHGAVLAYFAVKRLDLVAAPGAPVKLQLLYATVGVSWSAIRALAVVQNLAPGFAAVPIHAIALRATRHPGAALLLAVAWILSPLAPGLGSEAHDVAVLLPLVALGLAWAIYERSAGATLVCFLLALLIRDDAGIYVAMLIACTWSPLTRVARVMIALALGAFVLGAIVTKSAVATLASNPLHAIDAAIESPEKWRFIVLAFLPVLFAPFTTARSTLLVAPGLAYCLVASDPRRWSIEEPFTAALAPFVALGTVLAVARLREARLKAVAAIVIVLATALTTAAFAREPVFWAMRAR